MRRTRKWAFVAQEASRLASLGLSRRAIAQRLGLNKSTVTRWVQAGKLTLVASGAAVLPVTAAAVCHTPDQWATAVRDAYDLDATDEQLVTLAAEALRLAQDETVVPAVRLAAAGRFQALVRQLALVARVGKGEVPSVAPPQDVTTTAARTFRVVRRDGADPRTALQAVK